MTEMNDLRMAKFYVVDGVTYPAAEAAVGEFGKHGSQSKAACMGLRFTNAKAKGSLTLEAFLEHVVSLKPSTDFTKLRCQVAINPSAHYLENSGFGVQTTDIELELGKLYLVDGLTYQRAETSVGIKGRNGFETMYAVCKFGAFMGRLERNTMTASQFMERLVALDLCKRYVG